MNKISHSKIVLRKEMKKLRSQLTREEIFERSRRIHHNFYSLRLKNSLQNYMSYVSIDNEVSTLELIGDLLDAKKNVSVPICVPETTQLIASKIYNLDELTTSHFGLLEPRNEFIRPVDPMDLDVVLIPGLAFDRNCNRLGHGKGYYDRFLTKISSNALKIGLAYSFQILEQVPKDSFDIKLDIVITEKEILSP